jgi:hypothetical protein
LNLNGLTRDQLIFSGLPPMRFASALVAATLLVTPAAASSGDFRDFWAACDNLRNCSAYGFDTQLTGGGYIRIERGGAPSAPPKISVVTYAPEGVSFKLSFDDPALPGLPAAAQSGEELDVLDMRRVSFAGASVAPLIDSLRKAKEIVITRIDPPGKKSEPPFSKISLNGAVAAMLWIDEQQQRLGTVTALVRRGDKPVSSIPAQPKAPLIVAAKGLSGAAADRKPPKRDQVALRKKAVRQCGDGDEGELEDAIALSADTFLYPVRCPGASGAYNHAYVFLLARAGQPQSARSLSFQWPMKSGQRKRDAGDEDFLVNADFSNVDMTMRTFSKGRGIGDCGDEERWVWDGKSFQPAEVKTMPHCKGVPAEDWPTVYRADVK